MSDNQVQQGVPQRLLRSDHVDQIKGLHLHGVVI